RSTPMITSLKVTLPDEVSVNILFLSTSLISEVFWDCSLHGEIENHKDSPSSAVADASVGGKFPISSLGQLEVRAHLEAERQEFWMNIFEFVPKQGYNVLL
ncbi:hypothetical protein Ancab_016992, partial [Ancistrocladus abbreviatus]